MKKIFYLAITICFTFLIGVSLKPQASSSDDEVNKPLVCQVGKDYFEYLEYPGYTMMSNNINFNICGEYLVKYLNNKTLEIIYKFLYVKDAKTLETEKCFSEQYETLYHTNDNLINGDTIKLSDQSYIYSISKEKETHLSYYDIHIYNYKDGLITFDTILLTDVRARVVDIIENKDEIVILLEAAYNKDYQDIYLFILNKQGNITYQKRFMGSNVDNANKVLVDNNNYYVVGDTLSNDGDYSFYHTEASGFVFVLNQTTKEVITCYELTNKYANGVIGATISNNQLYVMTSQYNYELTSLENFIYIFDNSTYTFEKKRYFFTKASECIYDMKTLNNDIYISLRDYDNDKNMYYYKIVKYDQMAVRTDFYEYYYPYDVNATLVDFNISINEEIIMLYNLASEHGYGYLYQITKDGKIECQIENFSTNGYTTKLLSTNEFLLHDKSNIYVDNIYYSICKEQFDNIKVKFNKEVQFPKVYIDGTLQEIDSSLSKIDIDFYNFGIYDVQYFYKGKKQDVICYGNVEVLPYTNIYEGGVFDTGYVLKFNGQGILNNVQINSNYQIIEPGNYTLTLQGNKQSTTVNFKVQNLSTNNIILNEQEKKPSLSVKYSNDESNIIMKSNIITENITPKIDYQIWYILIPICVGLFTSFIVFKKRG